MSNPDDIHGFDKGYLAAVERLNNAEISDKNKELIRAFVKDSKKKGNKKSTYTNDLNIALRMARFFGKDLDTLTEDDFDGLLDSLESRQMVDYNYRKVIKKFFRWLLDDDLPKWVRKMHLPHEETPVQPSDLWKKEQLDKLIDSCEHPRDRALVTVTLDSLQRIGAVGTLRIKSVEQGVHGDLIYLSNTSENLKTTDPKPIPLTWSTGYLNQWLSIHPLRDNPDAPLWINLRGAHKYGAMTYNTMRKLLLSITERAEVNKKMWFHLLKHQGVTGLLLKGFKDSQIKYQAGWTPDSDRMLKIYGNFTGKDMIDAIYRQHGLEVSAAQQVTLEQCPRCRTVLIPDARVCHQCALILDRKVAQEVDEKTKVLTDIVQELSIDPSFQKIILDKLNKVPKS